MHYHAHVYWHSQEQRQLALSFRSQLELMGCTLGRVHDVKVGPHPMPMYQVNYNDQIKAEVESWLTSQADGLSVLLHEDTGDDLHDHTKGAIWLGAPLQLDLVWLAKYQSHKHEHMS